MRWNLVGGIAKLGLLKVISIMEQLQKNLTLVEERLAPYFLGKVPQLPSDIRKILGSLTPWFAVISVVLGIINLLVMLGVGTVFSPVIMLGGMMRPGLGVMSLIYLLSFVYILPSVILQGLAINPLFAGKKIGWRYLFYTSIWQVLVSVVSLNILGAIVGGAISLYLLFQVREYFTK